MVTAHGVQIHAIFFTLDTTVDIQEGMKEEKMWTTVEKIHRFYLLLFAHSSILVTGITLLPFSCSPPLSLALSHTVTHGYTMEAFFLQSLIGTDVSNSLVPACC